MKLSLFERAITCCLLGAGTIAVASGMKLTAHPTEGTGGSFVSSDGDDELAVSTDEDQDVEEGLEDIDEGAIAKLIAEAQEATDEAKEDRRNALKDALSEVFRKRTQAQRTRIEGMKARLESIESQLERRSNLEDQIVQRRLAELLGDKDELSWDHEPAIDFDELGKTDGPKHFWGRAFGFEFPKELSMVHSDAMATFGHDKIDPRAREQFLQAKKQAEQAKKQAEQAESGAADTVKRFLKDRNNQEAAAMEKNWTERIHAKESERGLRGNLNNSLDRKLPELERFQKTLEGKRKELEKFKGKDGEMDALRGKLEAMQAQSKMLEQQLEGIAKMKAEAAKNRGR